MLFFTRLDLSTNYDSANSLVGITSIKEAYAEKSA